MMKLSCELAAAAAAHDEPNGSALMLDMPLVSLDCPQSSSSSQWPCACLSCDCLLLGVVCDRVGRQLGVHARQVWE